MIRAFTRVVCVLQISCFMVRAIHGITLELGERLASVELQVVDVALHAKVESLEPDQADGMSSSMILDMVLDTLVRFESGRRFAPAAATHWTYNAEQTAWCFYLRKEAKWSNGDLVKAEDFVRTYRNYCDPEIRTKINAVFIKTFPLKNAWAVFTGASAVETLGVRAVDDYTLELAFEGPMQENRLLTILTQPIFAPLHLSFLTAIRKQQNEQINHKCRHDRPQADKHGPYLKDELPPEEQALVDGTPFISNGPFVITDLNFGAVINAVKNPYYWDADNIILEKLSWRLADSEARNFWEAALRNDAWNVTFTRGMPLCPSDLRTEVLQHWGREHTETFTQTTDLLILNTQESRLQNREVRRALDMLLNRQVMVKALLRQSALRVPRDCHIQSEISHTLIPPSSDYLAESRYAFQLLADKERQALGEDLLRQAGYNERNPLRIKLSIVSKGAGKGDLFDELTQQELFKTSAICVTLEPLSFEERDDRLRDGNFELAFAGYAFMDQIPESIFYACKSFERLGCYARLNHPEYDALVDSVVEPSEASKLDKTERYDRLREAEQLLMNEHALLPISHTKPKFIVKRNLRGFAQGQNPKGYIDFRRAYVVDLPNGCVARDQGDRIEKGLFIDACCLY